MTYPMQGSVDGIRGDHFFSRHRSRFHARMIQILATTLTNAISELDSAHLAGTGGTTCLDICFVTARA